MTGEMRSVPALLKTDRTGVGPLPDGAIDLIETAAQQAGYASFKADLGDCRDKHSLLRKLALAMHFPAWFGNNWDALADCVTDMSWLPATGYVIVLQHAQAMEDNAEEDFLTALDILAEGARDWGDRNIPMWVFVEVRDDSRIKLPEL